MSDDILRVQLTQLEYAVEQAFATGLTPLIVDTSSDDRVCTFYSYQSSATLLEAKQIVMKGRGQSNVELLEPFRKCLVNSMKYGRMLVVRLANSAPSLYCKWNDERLGHNNKAHATAYFPEDVFYEGGKRIHDSTDWHYRLFREEDMFPNKNIAYCRDEFRVCFTSQFQLEDLDDFLFKTDALPPRENFKIIYIIPEEEEKDDEA